MSNFLIDEETDLLAAEFVLGSLDSAERAKAHEMLRSDHAFIGMVRIWERRFGELHLMVEPVDPDPAILRRIKAKVVALSAPAAVPQPKAPAEAAPAAPPAETVRPAPSPPAASPQMPKAANIDLKPLQATEVAVAPPAPAAVAPSGQVASATAAPEAPAEAAPAGGTSAPPAPPAETSVSAESVTAATVTAASAQPATVEPATPPPTMEPPAMFPPAPAAPESPAEVSPAPEVRPPDIKLDREPVAKVSSPPLLPPAARIAERFPQGTQGRSARAPEVTIDVIRSRGRWRALGIVLSVLVLAVAGLLAAWRFAPDHLPPKLRPGEFMAAFGFAPAPAPPPKVETPAPKPAPPTGQFDE